jgi:predicted phosphodiesterase
MVRRIVYGLLLLAALALGAAGFEVLETVSIAPRVTMTVLEPSAHRDMLQYTVMGRGVSILDADDTTVTVRAWAPTPTVSVFPRGTSSITIRMVNIPERATLAESPGVSETRRGLTRVLSVKGTARQDLSYTAPTESVAFAGLGDTGITETLEQALITARSLGCDFFFLLGDLVYNDHNIPRVREILDHAPLPVYVVRGNHDHHNQVRRELLAGLGPSFYSFSYGGTGFAMLDTGRELIPGLAVESEQHEWLQRTLTLPIGNPLIVVMHKSPVAGLGEPRRHQMLDGNYAQRLEYDLERAGVRLVLAGHRHTHGIEHRGDVTYVTSGEGIRRRADAPVMAVVAVRAGTVAVDFAPVWPATR